MRDTMKRLNRLFVKGLVLASLSHTAFAKDVTIGTMPVGSGWYVAGAAIKKVVEANVPDMTVEIISRGGGVANPMVVQAGKANIALSNVATSMWASEGMLLYNGKKADDIRSLVGGLNPVFFGALVRKEFLDKNGFKSLDDILKSDKAVNIMMKPPGSNIPPTVEVLLSAYGKTIDDIKNNGGRIIQVNPSQMSGMMRDGRADLYFDTILRGHPTIQEITLTSDVVFLPISEYGLDTLKSIGMKPGKIPKWFDNQTEPVAAADFGTHLIANKSMSDEMAYQITKVVIEHMPELAKDFAAWKSFDPKGAALPENNGIRLHPGAIKYYQEIGLL